MATPDTFAPDGAQRLANAIRKHWLSRGGIVKTSLEPLKARYESETGRQGTISGYVVRTDMKNGYPIAWEPGRRPAILPAVH